MPLLIMQYAGSFVGGYEDEASWPFSLRHSL
jgi:hypothetical protein